MRYPAPFNPESGLNAILADLAETEENWTEAARQWTQAAKFSDKPEQCLARANWCNEMAFNIAFNG